MSGLLDAAIAVHPRAWRERYAAEVRSTLLDVADERDGRVPLSETVTLLSRGLWLRARSSVTFWAGLVVVGILLASALTLDVNYLDGSLLDLALRLNNGIACSLPVLALAAGWEGARARRDRISGAAARLRRLTSDSWPLLAFFFGGYAVAVLVLAVRSEVVWFAPLGALAMLGQAVMALAAIATGQLLGAVLPRVLVIFAAPFAIAVVTLLLFAWQTPWIVAPFGLYYPGLAYVMDTAPFVRVALVATVIVISAVLAVSLRSIWWRALPAFVLTAVTLVVAVQPVDPPDDSAFVERPRSELVCSTAEPIICLWPEQEAAFGASLRDEMGEAYATALDLGLPVDGAGVRSVAQYSMTAIPAPRDADWLDPATVGFGTSGMGPNDLLPFYAFEMPACCWEAAPGSEYEAVAYAVSILLGVPADEALPSMPDPYTGERQFDPSEVPDEAAARALVERWLSEGVPGVRAP